MVQFASSPWRLTTRQFYESVGRGHVIPSSEGCRASGGVGTPRPGGPLRLTSAGSWECAAHVLEGMGLQECGLEARNAAILAALPGSKSKKRAPRPLGEVICITRPKRGFSDFFLLDSRSLPTGQMP